MDPVARTLAVLDRLELAGAKWISIAAVRRELTRPANSYELVRSEPAARTTEPGRSLCGFCLTPVTVEPDGTLRGHGGSTACPGSGTTAREALPS